MTTIAYDGTYLAVDRAGWISGGMPYEVDKLRKVALILDNNKDRVPALALLDFMERRAWYAGAGSGGRVELIYSWLMGDIERPSFPENERYGLLVTDNAICFAIGQDLGLSHIYTCPWADGVGMDFVLGAMHAGKTAPEAVELCAKHTSWAAIGMDYVNVYTGEMTRTMFR